MMLKKKILAMALAGGLVLGGAVSVDAASLMSVKTLSLTLRKVPILADKAVATTCYGRGCDNVNKYEAYVKLVVTGTKGENAYSNKTTRTGWDAVSGEGEKGLCKLSFSYRQIQRADSSHKGKKNKSSSSWDESINKSAWRS
ncbi:MAG: hypothetical protein HDT30_10360 [Clostridiales bacterium]|nr:hypothetical protein [Clostridiales bacterium]